MVFSVIVVGCAENTPQVYTLNRSFEVQEGGAVTLTWGEKEQWIKLMVLDIEESRCPSDVVCIRFGEAQVKIGINGTQEMLQTLDMCIGDCPQFNRGFLEADTATVEVDGVAYAVILFDVLPYPTTINSSIPKKAVLKVIPG